MQTELETPRYHHISNSFLANDNKSATDWLNEFGDYGYRLISSVTFIDEDGLPTITHTMMITHKLNEFEKLTKGLKFLLSQAQGR